ncbi:flagellar biosynthesis protein [Paenibacillus baekrokdamisoli]|uniref:Flagellar biosynthesis protein n=1 Tax=Paenibacillus baekrokdamisoli TaxID=1712516 RepID=A0A3G9JD35_9BACL|nr:TIGR02530 family flagellar biosynthesis protein [Paenibacillus baekrokdamisoli]MBB3069777.1 flagellar operon protein [Paenibacillus baekrokdamisoli]BBH20869.1 flagellar biosynthesis protein [Paenibacillus baekrokdamisoli]
MDDRITIGQLRLNGVNTAQSRKTIHSESKSGVESFKEVLDRNVLNFSHHAEVRMKQRGITLKPEILTKIGNAIDDAAAKGAKDSLILYRDIAMIVNVPSRTVVTALDGNSLKGNVFTQIDSAVIVS